jgi:hypothetical protein
MLTEFDPTVFAKCPRCDKRGRGVQAIPSGVKIGSGGEVIWAPKTEGFYYGKAFSIRQWRREPICENCHTRLVEVRRIKLDEK